MNPTFSNPYVARTPMDARIGVFVNDDQWPYAQLIVAGYKTVETRSRNVLGMLAGQWVGIIRTANRGVGPKRSLIGFMKLGGGFQYNKDSFNCDRVRHQTPKGGFYDWQPGDVKWGYPVLEVRPALTATVLGSSDKAGRSFRPITEMLVKSALGLT